ncbi:MAG: hypothetical protein ACI9BW_004259 [Gammaproteobacteria bacterium]|jgi:hypothetical protein
MTVCRGFGYTNLLVLVLLLEGFGAQPCYAFDESVRQGIVGVWTLNVALSDSVEKKFSAFDEPVRGGFREGGIGAGTRGKLGPKSGARTATEIEYQADEPDRIARTVSMRKILSAPSIAITGDKELLVIYDEKYQRKLIPNPYGRVFSASGDELIADDYGYTLSFWRKNELVVETTSQGVDIVERYRYQPKNSKLKVSTSVTPSGRAGIQFVRIFDAAGS